MESKSKSPSISANLPVQAKLYTRVMGNLELTWTSNKFNKLITDVFNNLHYELDVDYEGDNQQFESKYQRHINNLYF